MKILIKTLAGSNIPLKVEPTDRIADLKAKIQEKEGFPPECQVLMNMGTQLADNAMLQEYCFQDNSTLDLRVIWRGSMRIYVIKILNEIDSPQEERRIPLDVDPTTKIEDVKAQIRERTGTPPEHQRLTFDGKELTNGTLQDYAIQSESVLILNIPWSGRLRVRVWSFFDSLFRLDAEPTTRIEDLKVCLSEHFHVPPHQQRLTVSHGEEVEDGQTIKDYFGRDDTFHPHFEVTLGLRLTGPVQIVVETPAGRHIPLEVEPTDSIKDVEAKIQEKEGLLVERQCLVFCGKCLYDSDVLQDCWIRDNSKLNLHIRSFGIMHLWAISTFDNRRVSIRAEPTDRIEDVKSIIQAKVGFRKDHQRLIFDGKELEDSKMLQDYAIQRDSTLDLVVRWPGSVQIFAETPTGKRIPLEVELTDRIEDVKTQIWEKGDVRQDHQCLIFDGKELEGGKMLQDYAIQRDSTLDLVVRWPGSVQIFAEIPTGKRIPLEVELTDKIEDVKTQIWEKAGFRQDHQRLIFDERGLNTGDTLQDYSIQKDSTLHVDLGPGMPMQIFIKTPAGRKVPLVMKPTDRIDVVKARIWENAGFRKELQRLIFDGKELDDAVMLQDYAIQDKSTLDLVVRWPGSVQIFAETSTGKRIPLEVELTDKIEDVKTQISEKAGFRQEHQRLIFDGKELENGNTLQYYSIQKDSTLHVDLGPSVPMQIFIETPGRSVPLDVQSTEKIEDVRAKIHDKEGVLPEVQRLFFGEKELEDGNTLQDYSIPKDSKIDLLVHWSGGIQIFLEQLHGKGYRLEVDPLDRIADLKVQILQIYGIPTADQWLIFDSQELEDDLAIEYYGICDTSVVMMRLRLMG